MNFLKNEFEAIIVRSKTLPQHETQKIVQKSIKHSNSLSIISFKCSTGLLSKSFSTQLAVGSILKELKQKNNP
jgi:hypothetical protein